ncbi:MAG: hypothetical protein HS111_24590 [Kofleriaceae bacterium]|nr:hypothetical protein [Kofleriaceae bacterium]
MDTPDGDYQARITVTHADGRVEILHLGYTIDTTAPAMKLTATWTGDGYRLEARQSGRRLAPRTLTASRSCCPTASPPARAAGVGRSRDVDDRAPRRRGRVQVVVRDRALNQAVLTLTVAP